MDRSGLESGERVELLLAGGKRRERLACVRGEHAPGLGQPAAAAVSLDEPLAGGGLEKAQVLARARLPDPDRARGGRDASLPLELDEQPQARRVPEERERAIGQGDDRLSADFV